MIKFRLGVGEEFGLSGRPPRRSTGAVASALVVNGGPQVIECRGVPMDLFALADEVPVPDIPLCAIRQLPEQLAADAFAKAHGKDVRFAGNFRYGDFVEVRWPEHGIYVPRSSAAIVADARKRS
ncbi:unnamed protein product [Prorocentrum cordatum]|uniref:Uncharacterized protein n=1 Tax=Prorocentrum cordatum TaxID=2364126 RepID=A0ABN9T5N9_9DINO|nr:unnamed protein product [Polarella glacialis]